MTQIPYEVPLTPQSQKFSIALGAASYNFKVWWSDAPNGGGWTMDIADNNNTPIVGGIPLVTGADLLAQYTYLGFAGSLEVQTDFDLDAVPDFTNLGVTAHLYFLTDDGT